MRDFAGLFPRTTDGAAIIVVQESIYSKDAILKACYSFTDRCYVYLKRQDETSIQVFLAQKDGSADLSKLVGEFCNEMIDQRLRVVVSRESGKIREIIVAQAFAEGDLLDEQAPQEMDYNEDPLKIGDSSEHKAS